MRRVSLDEKIERLKHESFVESYKRHLLPMIRQIGETSGSDENLQMRWSDEIRLAENVQRMCLCERFVWIFAYPCGSAGDRRSSTGPREIRRPKGKPKAQALDRDERDWDIAESVLILIEDGFLVRRKVENDTKDIGERTFGFGPSA